MSCGDQECPLPRNTSQGMLPGVTYLSAPPPQASQGQPLTFYSRRSVYNGLVQYYGDLIFQKVDSPNPAYSMYACQIACLCSDKRFLFAITLPDHNQNGYKMLLSRISWISFQARVSNTEYNVMTHSYNPVQSEISQTTIRQIEEKQTGVVYKVDNHPLKLELLGNKYYHATGTIGDALEMFATVIYFT